MGVLSILRQIDVFPKTNEEFRIKTTWGGAISLISIVIVLILVISEFFYYLEVQRLDELMVDTEKTQRIPIYLNITFPSISCSALSLDVMDVSGEHQIDVEHTFYKTRLDLDGRKLDESKLQLTLDNKHEDEQKAKKAAVTKGKDYCGDCYGAAETKSQCCNSCEEVRQAYKKKGWSFTPKDDIEQCYAEVMERKMRYARKEGCNLQGHFYVNKVAGNFHFAPGRAIQSAQIHLRDYISYEVDHFNTSHIIHNLAFGVDYPGLKNPLDGTEKIIKQGSGLFQYFIRVVPTIYEYSNGEKIRTNQYSVTQHMRPRNTQHKTVVPGVFFIYDLSPIMCHFREVRKSFFHFLTSLCAIVGGIISVSALIDRLVARAALKDK